MGVVEKWLDPNASPGSGDGSPGNPYATFDEWQAAEATDLVSAVDQHVLNLKPGVYSAGSFVLSGWTTNATNNITIQGEVGNDHAGALGQGFQWIVSTNARVLQVDQQGTVVQGFYIEQQGNFPDNSSLFFDTTASDPYVNRMIIGPSQTVNDSNLYINGGARARMDSSLLYGRAGWNLCRLTVFTYGTTRNCTLVNTSGNGWYCQANDPRWNVWNTAALVDGEDYRAVGQVGSHNASGDGTQPGTDPVTNLTTAAFTDFDDNDYTIASQSSPLYDQGTNAPDTQAPLDLRGIPFTGTEIGCYAWEGAAPGDPVDVDLPSKQVHVQAFTPQVEAPAPVISDLPSKQVHVQPFAPQVQVPTGADVDLPSKQVHVQAFAPEIDAPTDVFVDLPFKQIHVQAFAPEIDIPTGADIDLPSKQIHVQPFAPVIVTGDDTDILLPSKQIHVQAFVPQVEAPFEVEVDLPSKQIHVQAFAPIVDAPTGAQTNLPSKQIYVEGFAPQVDAPTETFVDLPSKQIHVQAFPPIVQTVSSPFINLPSKQIYVQAFAPTIDVNQPVESLLPSKFLYVRAFPPRIQAGTEEGFTLWEAIEEIKMAIKPKIEALGLTQIMWPNIPMKRDSKTPFVQISIAPSDRELGDLGGLHRTIGILVTALHTPYGNDPGMHNRYVDGLMKMVSNTYLKGHILFWTSIPITVGRRDSWWVTNVETEFYLEGV